MNTEFIEITIPSESIRKAIDALGLAQPGDAVPICKIPTGATIHEVRPKDGGISVFYSVEVEGPPPTLSVGIA